MASRDTRANLALLVLSALLSVLAFEVGARLLIRPSAGSWGTLLGRALPPLRVIPPRLPEAPAPATATADTAAPAAPRADDPIGWLDMQGPIREDPVCGYAPLERATSPHGWWTTNNIGARSTTDTQPQPPPGVRRVLVFGESFASGSRVRQEAAWPSVLAASDGLDVVNLAVDGYGLGQSLLRFRQLAPMLDYDTVLLVFVPSTDLWRDVNTIRSLAKPSWNSYTVMPRFVLQNDGLVLAQSPYARGSDIYADNAAGLAPRLRDHLRAYDRFYFRSLYESPPVVGGLVLYKIGALVQAAIAKGLLLRDAGAGHFALDSEALRVSRKIVETMRDETSLGKGFVLAILPDHATLRKLRRSTASARNWHDLVAAMCDHTACIDLAPPLLATPPEQLDRGFDGSHFGPSGNRLIAAAIGPGLRALARIENLE
ncbi:MAG TPA: hypothetical protein VGK30_10750 [Candidatus Binatia bacterium]